MGEKVNIFLRDVSVRPCLIASHGHTVFHRPAEGITFQLGDGNTLAAITNIPVIFDFRSLDVALGGQGAPLVPLGDRLLFPDYDYCLNMGGFANISYEGKGGRTAYDPCPVNLAIQHLMRPLGYDFDRDGETGRQGKIHGGLLKQLNELDFYQIPPPKSLGKEWLEIYFFPVLDRYRLSPEDKLRTVYEHITTQICKSFPPSPSGNVLVTGGGAHNIFLIELLRQKCTRDIVVPDNMLIDFKEALVFALLGILRRNNRINCLSSVTGAKKDTSSGTVVLI